MQGFILFLCDFWAYFTCTKTIFRKHIFLIREKVHNDKPICHYIPIKPYICCRHDYDLNLHLNGMVNKEKLRPNLKTCPVIIIKNW